MGGTGFGVASTAKQQQEPVVMYSADDLLWEEVGKKHGSVEKENGEGPLVPLHRNKKRFREGLNSWR